jgi:hypothetical protein
MPVELPWWQRITFETTAWRINMARRQVVESANSTLKGAFADLSRGFFRLPGHGAGQNDRAAGFTLAAYNLDRVRTSPQRAMRPPAGAPRPWRHESPVCAIH